MYNLENKHYIFKKTSGNTWHIFYSEKYGLCYRVLEDSDSWSTPLILAKDMYPDYYADMDENNCIHIVYQDTGGNLNYLRHDGNVQTNINILRSRTPYTYKKYVSIIPRESGAEVMFVIKDKESLKLAHQFVTKDKPGNPKVVDYVMDDEIPYSVITSKDGTITVFYQVSDGKYRQLGTRKMYPSSRQWGEFTPVTRYNGNCEYPRPVNDANDLAHLCYQRQQAGQFELIYQQKQPDKNIWSPETVIQSSIHPFKKASLAIIDNRVVVFWIRNNIIFFSFSYIEGNNWSRPQKYNISGFREIECVKYKSNAIYEQDKIISPEIPAAFSRSYRIAFYEEVKTPNETTPPPLLKDLIVESLNTLKNNVDDLKKSVTLLDEKLFHMESENEYIRKELVKVSLRMKEIDNLKASPALLNQIEKLNIKHRELEDKINNTNVNEKSGNNNIGEESSLVDDKKEVEEHVTAKDDD